MTPETATDNILDLDSFRKEALAHDAEKSGPAYWRSLEEFSGNVEIDEFVHREFPASVNDILDPVSRRNFMKVMGASMMLAGLASCSRQPEEKIVPYVKPPEERIEGKSEYYATAMPFAGYGIGLVATSFEGRPTKVDGLPEHPSSLGGTDVFAQASLLDMYDPDRLDAVLNLGGISTWTRFVSDIAKVMAKLDPSGGDGLRILTETVTSPTLGWQLNKLRAQYPAAQWHQFEVHSQHNERAGSLAAFGQYADTLYDFSKAKVILSLDSDFLVEGPGRIRHSVDYANSRDAESNRGKMSRLYVAESIPTLTGANADHKVGIRFRNVEALAQVIANRVGAGGEGGQVEGVPEKWLQAVVEDLTNNSDGAIVIAGTRQPASVHALVHAINKRLATPLVKQVASAEVEPTDQWASLTGLVQDMNAGKVSTLLILSGNPVYNTPGDLNFASAMDKVSLRIHLTQQSNETSAVCHWVLPESHYLEAWGDVRGHDGTASIIQPLILPLYTSKSSHEVVAMLTNDQTSAYDTVRNAWKARRGPDDFDRFWKVALAKGIVEESASAPITTSMATLAAYTAPDKKADVDLNFAVDSRLLDGRYANNGWLQELPKPLTNLTWDNAAHIHPLTAKRLGLVHEGLVRIQIEGGEAVAPVMVQAGHPLDSITVHFGFGREACGRVGKDRGVNFYLLQSTESPWFRENATVAKAHGKYELVRTEEHWNIEQSEVMQSKKMQDRSIVLEYPIEEYLTRMKDEPHLAAEEREAPPADETLYHFDEKTYMKDEGYAWAMAIDLNRCTGCGVCTIACQAENNIAVVGKSQVANGREMHWIRVDRYYKGDWNGNPTVAHQPIPCMQCENAPCETVCPVGATQHSKEGLNDMVYNRCIGTRYCGNNCPYKVRRFNFFKYSDHETPQLKMMRNPNVTVRSRGVMEKCTYCVQRINIARIDAKREGRRVADGEIVTACQQACPSRAIFFGDKNDPKSRVAKQKNSPRDYGVVADLGTRPRTTYQARLKNESNLIAAPVAPHTHHTES